MTTEGDGFHGLEQFHRDNSPTGARLTLIGSGSIGGKARGLVAMHDIVTGKSMEKEFPGTTMNIPAFTVICTDVFDAFIERNGLAAIAGSDEPDDIIAHEFQRASLPVEILGDLRSLIEHVHAPLAIRSSSLLEDALFQPFAGVYTTKMIPNNQPSPDNRFQKLMEAVKLVYASTFSRSAKDYRRAIGRSAGDEKMAVILQEVVGTHTGERFYPAISGVARSYNFYSMGRAKPEDGVISLALGLGKTIVDGGVCWTYSPALPAVAPPFASADDMFQQTQSTFWAVNMGKPPEYDPIHETEYLLHLPLSDAEADGNLRLLASTYDVASDRIRPGLSGNNPRVLNFSGILVQNALPLNAMVKTLLDACSAALEAPVEVEFAMTPDPPRLGLLQVRPMVVSNESVSLGNEELTGAGVVAASESVLGNGTIDSLRDIVWVRPETFETKNTQRIAAELEEVNRKLLSTGTPYVLIGFGRWGSSDPWLGIPVTWGQVCGAKVIVEATRPSMDVEISQGAHFFHNLTSFSVVYFCIPHNGRYGIDWEWLDRQPVIEETELIRHSRVPSPLSIRVDGRSGRGVIRAS